MLDNARELRLQQEGCQGTVAFRTAASDLEDAIAKKKEMKEDEVGKETCMIFRSRRSVVTALRIGKGGTTSKLTLSQRINTCEPRALRRSSCSISYLSTPRPPPSTPAVCGM